MAHIHSVYDTGSHFIVDPDTRTMKNASESKITILQYDHNSERITFELPRYVDGHDMSLCNVVEVHYLNKGTSEQYSGVYEVDDLQVSTEDENVVICSWLVSQNATRLAGSLQFLIRFACSADGGVIDYSWSTAIYTGLSVVKGLYNAALVVEQYADVLEQWRRTIADGAVGIAAIYQKTTAIGNGSKNTIVIELTNGTMATFSVSNGTIPNFGAENAGKLLSVGDDGEVSLTTGGGSGGGVQDVQVNGASFVTDGVANINLNVRGFTTSGNNIFVRNANENDIRNRTANVPITCYANDIAVKAAMCDGKGAAWTEDEQAAARDRLGIVDTPTTPTQTISQTPTVYCWGDSLTEGVGGWLATPENVQNTIVSAYPDMVARSYPCVNLGCRGETIQTIMARQGADPMVVGGFTIPASSEEDVVVGYLRGGYYDDNRLGIATASGDLAQPLRESEAGINPCLIAGVEGTLYRDYTADSEGRYAYRFRRMADGDAVTVDAGTQIETYAMRYYRNGVAVIWMGANGSVASHAAYIDKIKQMVAYGNYDNYLVLIAREYTSQWVLEDANSISKALTDTDGVCHLLYLPPELIRRGYTLAGIAASAGVPDTSGWTGTTDAIKLAAPLLMSSSGGAEESSFETLHFSAYGYKAIGKLVVERLGKLIGVQMGGGNTGGGGSTDKGYVTDGTDDFGAYAYKLTRSMTGVGNAVNTGVKLYDTEKDWTIALRYKDDMVVTDGNLGSVFELRKYFAEDSVQTAVYLRLMPQTDGSMAYNFSAGFGGFNFPFDNCPGYVEPTDGYHNAVIAKSGGNYEFYLDGGLAYNGPLGYAVTEDHLTDEPLYLFGRVEDGNTYNTVTGTIADFRVYNAYLNKTVVTNLIADMAS